MKIKVFVGFQFVSSLYSRTKLESSVNRAVKQVEKEISIRRPAADYTVTYDILNLDSGKNIKESIKRKIEDSDICLFELSEKNLNVYFELGVAYGLNKKIIYLIHQDFKLKNIPSDLSGIIFARYKNDDDMALVVAEEINEKVLIHIRKINSKKSVFDFSCKCAVNIVCPEIPKSARPKYANDNAKDYARIAKFGDPDTLWNVSVHVARHFPNIDIRETISRELMPNDLYSNDLICIGGPSWNGTTRTIMEYNKIPLVHGDFSEEAKDYKIYNTILDKEYRTELSDDGAVRSDIGVFAKLPSPSPGRCIYIIHGIQTYGVLGTALSFIKDEYKYDNINVIEEMLDNRYNYYMAMLKLNVVHDNVYNVFPGRIKEDDFLIYDADSNKYFPPK